MDMEKKSGCICVACVCQAYNRRVLALRPRNWKALEDRQAAREAAADICGARIARKPPIALPGPANLEVFNSATKLNREQIQREERKRKWEEMGKEQLRRR